MYSLISSILDIPSQYSNSTVTYIAGTALLILLVVFIDMVYRLIRNICARGRFD